MAHNSLGKLSPQDFFASGAPQQVIKGEFREPRGNKLHPGIDISSRGQDGIPAPLEFVSPVGGRVEVIPGSEWNTIAVVQPDGYVVQFLHASKIYSELDGQTISPGTPLGMTGNVAPDDVPIHLHVQVRTPTGKIVDPGWFFDAPPDFPRTPSPNRNLLNLEYRFTLPAENPFKLSELPGILLPVLGAAVGAAVSSFLAMPLETPSELLRVSPDWECEKLLASIMPMAIGPLALATGVLGPMALWGVRSLNAILNKKGLAKSG